MTRRAMTAACAVGVAVLLVIAGLFAGIAWENHRTEARSHEPRLVDVGFAQDMSTHHDQAILMAQTLSRDVEADVRGLADRIVATQTAEAATMRGWLDWFGEPLTSNEPMSWMHPSEHDDHGSTPPMDDDSPPMPGFASSDDLAHLASARGVDAEVWFLRLMIRHHEGGIEMATAAQNSDEASGATRRLALAMITEQGDEIGQMTLMLKARDAEPLPPA
ncbi:DUF305 domain-containing protein [Gordonia sp. PDNC005]|uniref:DUF305 domain-containing protein n=1 Tax=unclassified Gordonia (in: high G+C Gram-positive bacteria) TaxID=2657482 RepID=UPI0019667FE3|nr:DUF305 domain-containing protein [Gordonia sp. PDNC005]QRY62913.1 DUF305 domain-containing protein [Gordonia sp. PDNC005]